jgi:hypothetical protein
MNARLNIPEMQAIAADLYARCKPREGFVSERATLFLNADDIASLDAIARFLGLAASQEGEIMRIIEGRRR